MEFIVSSSVCHDVEQLSISSGHNEGFQETPLEISTNGAVKYSIKAVILGVMQCEEGTNHLINWCIFKLSNLKMTCQSFTYVRISRSLQYVPAYLQGNCPLENFFSVNCTYLIIMKITLSLTCMIASLVIVIIVPTAIPLSSTNPTIKSIYNVIMY